MLVLGGLLVSANGCGPGCMSKERKQAMLTMVPEKPRFLAFMLRSYTGSRQHLIVAAAKMLLESRIGGDPAKHELDDYIYILEAKQGLPGHFLSAASYYTRAFIQEALAAAAEVERRLEDPTRPGARETIRIDLVWVQGLELHGPPITLPHPDLMSNGNWAHAWRQVVGGHWEEIFGNPEAWRKITDKIESSEDRQNQIADVTTKLIESTWLLRKSASENQWGEYAHDLADALAALGDASASAGIERELDAKHPRVPIDPTIAQEMDRMEPADWSEAASAENRATVKRSREAMQIRMGVRFVRALPFKVAAGAKNPALSWAAAVQGACREAKLNLGMVVVTGMDEKETHAIALGEPALEMPAGVELLDAKTLDEPEWRRDERVRAFLRTGELFH